MDDCLKRHGWNGTGPIATSVITFDSLSGALRGQRFETRGTLPDIRFMAKDLWPDARARVSVVLKFANLSILNWAQLGDYRNITTWMDGNNLEYSVSLQDGTVLATPEQFTDYGVGKFSLRFTLLPVSVDKATLSASIIPLAKDALQEKLVSLGSSLLAPRIPTIGVKLLQQGNRSFLSLPIPLAPTEPTGERLGLGHLPLLESVGVGQVNFPITDDIEESTVTFLCAVHPTCNVAPARLLGLLATAETLDSTPLGSISHEWPEYRGPITGEPHPAETGVCD